MSRARQAVQQITEHVVLNKACSYCQQEFGITPNENETHGICKRHAKQMWMQTGMNEKQAQTYVDSRPPQNWAPDLAVPRPPTGTPLYARTR